MEGGGEKPVYVLRPSLWQGGGQLCGTGGQGLETQLKNEAWTLGPVGDLSSSEEGEVALDIQAEPFADTAALGKTNLFPREKKNSPVPEEGTSGGSSCFIQLFIAQDLSSACSCFARRRGDAELKGEDFNPAQRGLRICSPPPPGRLLTS